MVQFNENSPDDLIDNYIRYTERGNLILTKLNHKKIVKLWHIIQINNNSFCNIFEYFPGGSDLVLHIRKFWPVSEKFAQAIIYQKIKGYIIFK